MPESSQLTIRGEIEAISYHNSENGWSVLKLRPESSHHFVTVTGHFSHLRVGEHLELTGQWTEHKRHGRQFKAELAQFVRPKHTLGILRYLSSGLVKGIGEKTAQKIVERFQERTFEILDHFPERLTEVESIGAKKSKAIQKVWSENKRHRDVELLLNTYGLGPSMIAKILRRYGDQTQSILQQQPYRLATDIAGVGFVTADRIAQRMGIEADSLERIKAATVYVLRQAEDHGHCFLTSEQLLKKLSQTLSLDETSLGHKLLEVIQLLNREGLLASEPISQSNGQQTTAHYRFEILTAEDILAQKVAELLSLDKSIDEQRVNRWLQKYSELAQAPLSEQQADAARMAVSHRVFILTGGPGVGKTTTANAIIRLLRAMGESVALAAPTGRAAQRLSEVSGDQAKTVHRLLEWNPQTQSFNRDETNPLTAEAIIIDEASMLDVWLGVALFRAISPRSQIILIGDIDQLPSVGPGNILRDLMASNAVPYIKLDQIFRQAANSSIIQSAHQINRGETPELSDQPTSDCLFIELDSVEHITSKIEALVSRELPEAYDLDPVRDIQILTPMNRGELGTKQLNQKLQSILNHAPKEQVLKTDKDIFRPGDKVIQNSNNYDLNVFNGDIGVVELAGVNDGKLIVSFGDRTVTYSREDSSDLRLAYAITIHKSQGSEFPVVVIPIAMQQFVMLQRNLVYTALTRAKKLAIFIGQRRALQQAIQNQRSLQRQTNLIERLTTYYDSNH